MNLEKIKEIFIKIEEQLNADLIGQAEYFKELCHYFLEKTMSEKKGVLLIAGEVNTFKKVSLRHIFTDMKEHGLLESENIDEIDLSSYNFNFGYNAFLTDLNEKLRSDSAAVVFTNTEMASEEMLKTLSNLYPDNYLKLPGPYKLKNRFLTEADESDLTDTIDKIYCSNKFIVFIFDKETDEECRNFYEKSIQQRDTILFTRNLNKKDKTILMKKIIIKILKELETSFDVEIIFRNKDSQSTEEMYGILAYLNKFKEHENFTLMDYARYKIGNPLKKILEANNFKSSRILLYMENNEIYSKINGEIFFLRDYVTPSLDEVKYRLDSIVGMKSLKDHLYNIENNFKVQKIRQRLGLKPVKPSLNMIFVGNAGTGKTDAARITFEYLNSLGVLTKGVFKEVSKADFISDNIGETAKATLNIVNSAIGGVLFIDEAYSLQENESDIKGKIILETLMKSIEDHKDDLIVILAGYKKDMSTLLTYNQGLKSRFPNVITFNDYSPEEMYEIALIIAKNKGYNIDGNVKNDLIDLFTRNQVTERKSLGNARFVRNVIENAILDASKKYFSDPLRKIDLLDKSNFNFNFKAKFDLEQKLKNIIGLDEVKNLIRSQYKLLAAQEKRKSVGVATEIEQNLNMVFAGNPGTGKTSIARLVAEMLNSMGFLKRGQLIETDRSGFVSDIPGETSKKTEEKFKEAIGGILFIDEAYTLANDSLGREAIETLLKLIEDYSKEVIVILAGYNKEMEDFFDVNIGLRSRFPLWTTFEDYNPEELFIMAIRLLTSKGFKLSSNAYKELKKSFVDIYENSDMQSGNGRMVRNYAENLIRIQSIRVAEEDISVYEMNLITSKDVEKLIFSEQDSSYDLEKSLEKISGNEKSKEFLRNQYKLFKINEKRKRMGISSDINKYMNTLFTGEMGTGKQIILNAYAEMLYSIGIIKSKSPIEISVDEIILSLSGGKKMEDILSKGIGKIFFIDKAPLFMHEKNFSSISSEIIKFIDRNRNKLVIIFNGEKDEMKKMMEISPPLSYRFSTSLDFEDYSLDDLKAMAIKILLDKGYTMDEKCKEILGRIIGELNENKSIIIKNGLMIKQFLDNTIRAQSVRIYDEWESKEKINLIETTDLLKGKSMFLDKNS